MRLYVIAKQVSTAVDDEDSEVAGTYAVDVPDDVTPAKGAAIALDVFHTSVSVGTLDDFDFSVVDEGGRAVEQDEEHVAYSGEDDGEFLGRVSTVLRIDVDPGFVPPDGDAFEAVRSALDHFNIPTVISIQGYDEDIPSNEAEVELDKFQRFVADNYCDGEFSHLQTAGEAVDCGDGLLSFLMREISLTEDCDSREVAVQRIDSAIRQLQDLGAAFDNKFEAKPKPRKP